jgi:hypothetical protein
MAYLQKAVHILLATIIAVGAFHIFQNYGLIGLILYFVAVYLVLRTINRFLDWRDSRFRLPDL